jgi:hypothetical protein
MTSKKPQMAQYITIISKFVQNTHVFLVTVRANVELFSIVLAYHQEILLKYMQMIRHGEKRVCLAPKDPSVQIGGGNLIKIK